MVCCPQWMKGLPAAVLAASLMLAAGAAHAQVSAPWLGTDAAAGPATQPGSGERTAALAPADRDFLQHAAASGRFELEAARMALAQSRDEAVRRYAQTLIDQHLDAHQALLQLAARKGEAVDALLPPPQRRALQRLDRTVDGDFDATFVQEVGMRSHQRDLKLFRQASEQLQDAELRAWAQRMVPVLERHVAQARALPAARVPMNETALRMSNG